MVGRNQGFDYTGPAGGPGAKVVRAATTSALAATYFMGSDRARAMGMGDVTHGGPLAQLNFPTGISKGEGPGSIKANKYAGADMAGFLKDLHDAGAPLGQFAGAYVNKPLQHGYGNALGIETGSGSGPDNSPQLYAWAQAHQKSSLRYRRNTTCGISTPRRVRACTIGVTLSGHRLDERRPASPALSRPCPRLPASVRNSRFYWRPRQDSNLRPSA